MLEIVFIPINEIRIDLVAVVYDFFLACFTGYIVWFKTDEYMLRREERELFRREQQEYSRYLGRLCVKLKSYKQPDEAIRYAIEDLLENAPVRQSFIFQDNRHSELFDSLDCCFGSIQACLASKTYSYPTLLELSRDLSRYREKILSLRIQQPRTHFWKLWGKPSLANPHENPSLGE